MAENIEFEIGAKDTSDGVLRKVADELSDVQEVVQNFAANLKGLDSSLESAQKNLSGVAAQTREAGEALKAVSESTAKLDYVKQISEEFEDLGRSVNGAVEAYQAFAKAQALGKPTGEDLFKAAGITKDDLDLMREYRKALRADPVADADKAERELAAVREHLRKRTLETINAEHDLRMARKQSSQDALSRQNAAKQEAAQAAALTKETERLAAAELNRQRARNKALGTGSIDRSPFDADGNLRALTSTTKLSAANTVLAKTELEAAAATTKAGNAARGAAKAYDGFDSSLANTRYALHDLSMTAGMVGTAITAGLAVGVKTVADYETALANIRRTGEMSEQQAASLRDEMVSLAAEIPVAFTELGRIGELGGQLNVPAERIADFTESVAMFGATTDVTVDAAATAFGRLDALLPDVEGQYNRLGSSILKVGINSVATESEIISTTSQIAAAGAAAGMSADQVIGLSAAFASLGVAPEAARGTVIRVLGLMNAAVAEGGESLKAFAEQSGISAQQFRDSWGTAEFTNTFISFLSGIDAEGSKAQLALKDLGIWAARDQNNLLKLSQNTGTVVDIMADAASGFGDAGFMGEQFGIKADTLASKLQLLLNNLTNIVAQAGELGGGAFGAILDGVNSLLEGVTNLVDNPLVQWLTTTYAAMFALAGAMALAGSSVGRLVASSLALKPVMQQVTVAQGMLAQQMMLVTRAANAQGVALTQNQIRMAALGRMASGLITSLKGIAGGLIGGAALGAVFWGISKAIEATKSNTDKAREAFGDLSNVLQASKEDAAEAEKNFGSVGIAAQQAGSDISLVHVSLDKGSRTFRTAEKAASDYATAQDDVKSAADGATSAIENQILVIGEKARLELQETIIATEGMSDALIGLESAGFDVQGFLGDLVAGDAASMERARAQIEAFGLDANEAMKLVAAGANQTRTDINGVKQIAQELPEAFEGMNLGQISELVGDFNTVRESIELTEGAFNDLAIRQYFASITGRDAADAAAASADAFTDAELAASALDEQLALLSEEFSVLKASAQLGDSMAGLIEAFGAGALGAELMGGAVLQNVDTIQSAVEQSIKAGAGYGISAVQSVSAMFSALQQEGVDTAALLASLEASGMKSLGGISFNRIRQQMDKAAGSPLSNYFRQLADNARSAGNATGGAGNSMDRAARDAERLKEQVRTLVDYASDLSSIWTRAFDIRFGAQQAQDSITSSFNDIRKRIQDARDKVQDFKQKIVDLRAEGRGLASDRNITAYFQRIALAYGDTLRAGELGAKLADLDAKIAKNKQDLADAAKDQAKAQEETSTSLEGNSEQAIKNRQTITQLAQEYQKKIEKLAAAGLSEEELARQTEQLRQDFIKQATQLGFNRAELQKYADTFDDVRTAIGRIPRNITVTANTNPAIQAFNEFQAKAAASMASTTSAYDTMRGNLSKGINIPASVSFNDAGLQRAARGQEILMQIGNLQASAVAAGARGDMVAYVALLAQVANLLRALKTGGYAKGGFTGRGSKYEYAGPAHKGEFIIPQEGVDQSTGKPKAEWVAQNLTNTDSGANSAARISNMRMTAAAGVQKVFVVNPVEAGINTMHLLHNLDGGSVVITADQIGSAASTSNAKNNSIGAA